MLKNYGPIKLTLNRFAAIAIQRRHVITLLLGATKNRNTTKVPKGAELSYQSLYTGAESGRISIVLQIANKLYISSFRNLSALSQRVELAFCKELIERRRSLRMLNNLLNVRSVEGILEEEK